MSTSVAEAGAVVAQWTGGVIRLLLIRSSDGKEWLFPKGHVERGESNENAALRETREEAGVDGRVIAPLGTSDYIRGHKQVAVEFFLVEYRGTVTSDEAREQRWCTCVEACELLSFENLKTIAAAACRTAQSHFGRPRP